jgi:muramoyltetrapeptide carboxypeptidase LdcA involved in peptidoglycan recycling
MWDMASAIVFGRKQWPLEERQEVGNLLAELSGGRAPVLVGLDFGHISPIATIPLGAWAELDTTNNTLAISDSSARAADV